MSKSVFPRFIQAIHMAYGEFPMPKHQKLNCGTGAVDDKDLTVSFNQDNA